MKKIILSLLIITFLVSCQNQPIDSSEKQNTKQIEAFLADLKYRTFNFFWDLADTTTWQIPDRYPTPRFSSIAATGFGLSSYLVGIENNYISREQGAGRVLKTLKWLWESEQGPEESGKTGHKGFFYHFLTYNEGIRYKKVELSTIDTGLLMAGILSCQSYFEGNTIVEKEIRNLADSLYMRVEWDWAMNNQEWMSMGWHPEKGFIPAKWKGYNEAMILLVLALGSPTHAINDSAWQSWCKSYEWADFYSYEHVNFEPLFGHQYSQMYIDFRGIQDRYMREKGIDYFENSRRATLSNKAYCSSNPGNFNAYSESIWGLTACDGPENTKMLINEDSVQFWTYRARGVSAQRIVDDGTIAPTAAGGSIPFAPNECIDALYNMQSIFGDKLYHKYGFKDAFNLTYKSSTHPEGWFDIDYLGIDQGPIILQLENYQSELIWKTIRRNKHIINGLKRAGFSGGWLDDKG